MFMCKVENMLNYCNSLIDTQINLNVSWKVKIRHKIDFSSSKDVLYM